MIRILLVMLPVWAFAPTAQAAEDYAQFYEREYTEGERQLIQSSLTLHGLLDDKIDGKLGDKDITAIKQLKKETGIKVDGYLMRHQFDMLLIKNHRLLKKIDHRHFRDDGQKLYYSLPLRMLSKIDSAPQGTTFSGPDNFSVIVYRQPASGISLKEHFNRQQSKSDVSVIRTHLYSDKYIIQSEKEGLLSYKTALRMDDGNFAIMEVLFPKEKAKELKGIANYHVYFFAPIAFDKQAPEDFVDKSYFNENSRYTNFYEREYTQRERIFIQSSLTLLGLSDDKIDGELGDKDIAAVKQFQADIIKQSPKETDVEVDGYLTRKQFFRILADGQAILAAGEIKHYRDEVLGVYYRLPMALANFISPLEEYKKTWLYGQKGISIEVGQPTNFRQSIEEAFESKKKELSSSIEYSPVNAYLDSNHFIMHWDNVRGRAYQLFMRRNNGKNIQITIRVSMEADKHLHGLANYMTQGFAAIEFDEQAPENFVTSDYYNSAEENLAQFYEREYSKGERVSIETLLSLIGLLDEDIDGKMTHKIIPAVKKFQSDIIKKFPKETDVKVDGYLTRQQFSRLSTSAIEKLFASGLQYYRDELLGVYYRIPADLIDEISHIEELKSTIFGFREGGKIEVGQPIDSRLSIKEAFEREKRSVSSSTYYSLVNADLFSDAFIIQKVSKNGRVYRALRRRDNGKNLQLTISVPFDADKYLNGVASFLAYSFAVKEFGEQAPKDFISSDYYNSADENHAQFYEREYSEDEHIAIEMALTLIGLLDDKIDGELDDKHIKAIKQFQTEAKLKPDGYLTRDQFNKLLSKSDALLAAMDHQYFRDDGQKLYYELPLKLLSEALSLRPTTTFSGPDNFSIIVYRLPKPRMSFKEYFKKQQSRFGLSVIHTHQDRNKYIIQSESDGLLSYRAVIRMDDGDFASMEVLFPKSKVRELRGTANFLVRVFAPIALERQAPEKFVSKDYFSAKPQTKAEPKPKAEAQPKGNHTSFHEREYSRKERHQIQEMLLLLGFLDDEVDGKIGEKSITAIKTFQKETKLKPDGYLTRDQFELLETTGEIYLQKLDFKYFRDDALKLYYPVPLKMLQTRTNLKQISMFSGPNNTVMVFNRISNPQQSIKSRFKQRKSKDSIRTVHSQLYKDGYVYHGASDKMRIYEILLRLDDGDYIIMQILLDAQWAKRLNGLAKYLIHAFAPIDFSEKAPGTYVTKDHFGNNDQAGQPQTKPEPQTKTKPDPPADKPPKKAEPKGNYATFYEREYDLEDRGQIQISLMVLGMFHDDIDGKIGKKSIAAIKQFQKEIKFKPDGYLTRDQYDALLKATDLLLQKVGLRDFRDDALKLYYNIPLKLTKEFQPEETLSTFIGADNFVIFANRVSNPKASIKKYFQKRKKKVAAKISRSLVHDTGYFFQGVKAGFHIHEGMVRLENGDFFILAIGLDEKWAKRLNGIARYVIYSLDPTELGKKAPPDFVTSDYYKNRDQADRPKTKAPADIPPKRVEPEQPQPRQSKADKPSASKDKLPENGTGFFISDQGHLLTAQSLVKGCKAIYIAGFGKAKLVHADKSNNLAILKIKPGSKSPKPMTLAQTGGKLGQDVLALGYPALGVLSSADDAPSITQGVISRQSGLAGDKRFLTMSTPIQTGNKGGPLVDRQGRVVGMISSKLDAAKIASQIGDIPQNVNFALKSQMIELALLTAGVSYQEAPTQKGATMTTEQLASKLQSSVVALGCI